MKKSCLIVLSLIILGITAVAQIPSPLKVGKGKFIGVNTHKNETHMLPVDTALTIYFDRASSYWLYSGFDGGYIYGPSVYYDSSSSMYYNISDAIASHFDGIGSAVIDTVLLWCGAKTIVGVEDTIYVSVYDVANDTTPTNLLGTGMITTDILDTNGFFTEVAITGASITSSFLASVEYQNIDDTFGLISSDPDLGDGMGEKRARQLLSPDLFGSWIAVDDFYGGYMDCDVMIIPIAHLSVGVSEFKNDLFILKPVSPNPSTGLVSLEYSLSKATEVSYKVFDLRGKIVASANTQYKSASNYKEIIDLSVFSAGKYFITFNAGAKTLTQQFMIVK